MPDASPQPVYRKDYRPPDYWIDSVDLTFRLDPEETLVLAKCEVRRNPALQGTRKTLVLDGEELDLRSVKVNGTELVVGEFEVEAETLTLTDVPDEFELETEVAIRPAANTKLTGLYTSAGNFCTQCEAHGFRRITYFLDRPDVMARYSTRIEAERERFPVLLSNGNRVASGELADGRHWVRWEDPFPKPSYLFALVAGNLVCHRDRYTTRSGRDVALEVWVESQNADKCEHAMRSLQNSMKWDEDVFGLEYDLDVYMIVAVDDFNMGAMENKGLNVFNSKYVLARPDTATDDDYEAVEGVIGHEYFHNWTGNRVTCKDWFQLTLKEGLTVFRDQQFSADMTSPAVKRIQDVRALRTVQFAEDAGPMKHPIRPESYIEMNNFYTATVYEKGAEVVRLYHTLFGQEGFRRGMDLYFERHDGQAVSCDDFRTALADANDADLTQFERWYSTPGTPALQASGAYDEATRSYELTLRQVVPDDAEPGDAEPGDAEPLHMPVRVGLVGAEGRDLTERVLELKELEQTFAFDVSERPVPSVLRGFSAPVKLQMERSRQELAFLLAHDSDSFNRWDAGQELAQLILLELARDHAEGRALTLDPEFVAAFRKTLLDPKLDGSLKSLALTLPDERYLGQQMDVVDPDAIHAARRFVVRGLARALRTELSDTYTRHASDGPYEIDKTEIARRRIRNRALGYLTSLEQPDTTALAARQFADANNMTDYEAAFACLANLDTPETGEAIRTFHERWRNEPLVLDKWFRMQAFSALPTTTERVAELAGHPDFTLKNPNRVYALVGAFALGNQVAFHARGGQGYTFLADKVLELDSLNPQVAARMVKGFNTWKRFDTERQGLMRTELERIAAKPALSKDVTEIVGRALE